MSPRRNSPTGGGWSVSLEQGLAMSLWGGCTGRGSQVWLLSTSQPLPPSSGPEQNATCGNEIRSDEARLRACQSVNYMQGPQGNNMGQRMVGACKDEVCLNEWQC
jgi:hypothetical protein